MNTITLRKSPLFHFITFTVLAAFVGLLPAQPSFGQVSIIMPPPGQMIHVTSHFEPPQMVGLKIDLKDPFSFNFIMDQGQTPMPNDVRKDEFNKIIKYFLVSLAMPNKEMWVNLSPYERGRIIPQVFGQTEMGRDLLAQDYILKQFTASLIYPEGALGKKFWNKVYAQAQARFGTTNLNVNTFNKVWIVADKADVYQKGDTAFLVGSHLKVMMEQDFMAMEKHKEQFGNAQALEKVNSDPKAKMASAIVREIIIPAIEKEVNEGKSFAAVRQVYSAEIMATWFKKTLRQSLLGQVFVNRSKVAGQRHNDPQAMEKIYHQYLKAYKKGVFNYIKEDMTPDGQIIPRKYFSGGVLSVNGELLNAWNPQNVLRNAKAQREITAAMTSMRSAVPHIFLISALLFATLVGARPANAQFGLGKIKKGVETVGGKAREAGTVVKNKAEQEVETAQDKHRRAEQAKKDKFVSDEGDMHFTYNFSNHSFTIFQDMPDGEPVTLTFPEPKPEGILKIALPTVIINSEEFNAWQADRNKTFNKKVGNITYIFERDGVRAQQNRPTGSKEQEPFKWELVGTKEGSFLLPVPLNEDFRIWLSTKEEEKEKGKGKVKEGASQAMTHTLTVATIDPVGGINLSDEHLSINIKIDGAGMPLPAKFQDRSMMNLNGLTSVIRKIIPVTRENVPALYDGVLTLSP